MSFSKHLPHTVRVVGEGSGYVFAPAFLIISVSYVLSFVFDFLLGNNLFKTIVFLFFAPIQVLLMAYVLGTSKMEREGIVHFFNRKIKR